MGHKILYFLQETDNLVNGIYQPPVTCEIDLSNHCQNKCDFCFYSDYIQSSREYLPVDVFLKLITDLRNVGVKSITFTGGGEPLLSPHLEAFINWAKLNHMEMGLITNGILLVKYLDLMPEFRFVRVSIDAATKETYKRIKGSDSFSKVIFNTKRLVEEDITDVGISMVITDENKSEIEEFKKLGEFLKVKYIQVKPAWQLNNIEDITKEISTRNAFITERYSIDTASGVACKLAGLIGQVGANGKVYYCCVHRGKKKFEVGDLHKESFIDTIIRRALFKPANVKCGSCRYMNYAMVYNKVRDKKYQILRHRRFI